MPRTYLQEPTARRGNIHWQTLHDTSGFGAGRYPASSFDSPHVFGAIANAVSRGQAWGARRATGCDRLSDFLESSPIRAEGDG